MIMIIKFSLKLSFNNSFFSECSGVHRSLGVHYSKVRSLTLDDWEPEILKVMAELGNTVVNNVYEALPIPSNIIRATPKCNGYVTLA